MICTGDIFALLACAAWALVGSQGPKLGLCMARAEDGIGMQQHPNAFFPQLWG